jgi:serine protease AprX
MGRAPFAAMLFVALLAPLPAATADADRALFLVSFDDAAPEVGVVLAGARVLESFPFARVALVDAPLSSRAAIARLPGVAGVYEEEPIALTMERERQLIEADPPAGASWPGGGNVTVALVDSGIDGTHPAFAGRVLSSVRISRGGLVSADAGDADGHGTHVAGIVAGDGTGSANERHRGIAPDAKMVGVDISDSFTTTNAVRAFAWISENADRYDIKVVSNSWGREKDDAHYDSADPVIRASDALVESGIVVVFSAGNRGRDGSGTLTTEATNPNVITVGAARASGRVESYSSRGPALDGGGRTLSWTKPDVVAPGTAVVSTRAEALAAEDPRSDEERFYTVMNGTSMAAPQVAAAAALLLDMQPSLTPAQVQALLQHTAADLGAAGPDSETGYGMVDVAAALREASFASVGERRIIVETRVPVRAAGTIGAAAGKVVLTDTSPRAPPLASVDVPLTLPAGTSGVELYVNWSGTGSFDARLVGPDGPIVFERMGGQSLRLEADAAPGAWHVEIVAVSPAAYSPWTLGGSLVVQEEHVVEVAAESHSRPRGGNGGFSVAPIEGVAPLHLLSQAPWLVLAMCAVAATAFVVKRKR